MAALFGIKLRFKPKLEMERYKNRRMNRYIEHQVRRLDRCIKEGRNDLY